MSLKKLSQEQSNQDQASQDKTEKLIGLLKIAKQQLLLQQEKQSEPIAIIGMAVRFPGAENLDIFWGNLLKGTTHFSYVPKDRDFKIGLEGSQGLAGYLENIFYFDAVYFGLSAQEVIYMDPQQRLILQLAYSALVDAGFDLEKIPKKTGIIIGASNTDFAHLSLCGDQPMTPYSITGSSLNAIAGRVAYSLGTQGPAFSIDSACSSSLVAIDIAVNLLRSGQIDLAIVGGVNLILQSESTEGLIKTNVLSASGCCLPFSDKADGMMRGEGAGIVILQRETDQIKDLRPAYGKIISSAVNQDGKSAQLTAPNGLAQQALLSQALQSAKINPEQIAVIETHGTGTKLGDPIELHALQAIYGKREKSSPLYLGALKGNIGHLEAASGIAGFIKASLMAHYQIIPKNISGPEYKNNLNSAFDWQNSPFVISDDLIDLKQFPEGRRKIGVSGFGFSGTNAHVILEGVGDHFRKTGSKVIKFNHEKEYRFPFKNKPLDDFSDAYEFSWVLENFDELERAEYLNNTKPFLIRLSDFFKKDQSADNIFLMDDFLENTQNFIKFLQDLIKKTDLKKLINFKILVLVNSQIFLAKAALSLINSMRDEFPVLDIQTLEIGDSESESVLDKFSQIPRSAYKNTDFAYRDKLFYRRVLEPILLPSANTRKIYSGVYLITGGLGDIGRSVVENLLSLGVQSLAILSRQDFDQDSHDFKYKWLENLKSKYPTASLKTYRVDISDRAKLADIFYKIQEQQGPVAAIYHLAGSIIDGNLMNLSDKAFNKAIGGKLRGAWHLHELSLDLKDNLREFVLFSSACTYLVSRGQVAYAFANAFLNELAVWRASQGLPAVSIAWGAWENTSATRDGAVKNRLDQAGMGLFSHQAALSRMNDCLMLGRSEIGLFILDWEKFNQAKSAMQLNIKNNISTGLSIEKIKSKILQAIKQVIPESKTIEETDWDDQLPLESYGLNSLASVDLELLLSKIFNQKLSTGFMFSYPTIRSLIDYFRGDFTGDFDSPASKTKLNSDSQVNHSDIAIVGMACRLPGGINTPEALWEALSTGESKIETNQRMGWLGQLLEYPETVDYPWISQMGLMDKIESFDPGFFNISHREALYMDPQHRIALETAWQSLGDFSSGKENFKSLLGGIFVGAGSPDFQQLLSRDSAWTDPFLTTGTANSSLVGRIAYLLDWKGPSLLIDTACSSSLLAVYEACESLKKGACDIALAGGINIILTPATSLLLAKTQALSPQGQCAAFSEGANGFVRAEGCVFLVLKKYTEALSAGDKIYALIKGGAVNQDGRSQGMTAPNGKSQEAVMSRALSQSKMNPEDISYIEAHGTGTPLGDPIELEGIRNIYAAKRPINNPLYIGAVKANLGHMEGASGIAGLLKIVLQIQHGKILPHRLFEQKISKKLNLKNNHDQTAINFPSEILDWNFNKNSNQVAAISSFGFSGTNVHLIIAGPDLEKNKTSLASSVRPYFPAYSPVHCPIPGYSLGFIKFFRNKMLLPEGRYVSQMPFSAHYPFLYADHVLFDFPVIPGAFYLSCLMHGLLDETKKNTGLNMGVELKEIKFISAAVLNANSSLDLSHGKLQIYQYPSQGPVKKFECYTSFNTHFGSENFSKRCIGKYEFITENQDFFGGVDFKNLDFKDPKNFYELIKTQGVSLGRSFRNIKKYHRADNFVLSEIDFPDFLLSVGVLDSLFQTIGLCMPDEEGLIGGVRVPINIGSLSVYKMPTEACYAITKLVRSAMDQSGQSDYLTHEIKVFSARGDLLIAIKDLETQRVSQESLKGLLEIPEKIDLQKTNQNFLPEAYHWSWIKKEEKKEKEKQVNKIQNIKNINFIFLDRVFLELQKLQELKELSKKDRLVILFECSDSKKDFGENSESENLEAYIQIFYELCQYLIQYQENFNQLKFYVVSQRAFSMGPQDPIGQLLPSIFFGCLKTLRLEYPNLSYEWHDFDDLDIKNLDQNLNQEFAELLYLHRKENIFVPRLAPYAWSPKNRPYVFDPETCYLIVGATSRIAFELIQDLINRGVRKIALIQRASKKLDFELPKTKHGKIQINTYITDPCSFDAMEKIVKTIVQEMGSVDAVYHLIGTYSDGLMRAQSLEKFQKTIRPKVQSALILDQLFPKTLLVFFSSASTVFGGMGQGAYSGANQFLQTLASRRNRAGSPTSVIAWGDWAFPGQENSNAVHISEIGLKALPARQSLEALAYVMSMSLDQGLDKRHPEAVFSIDWSVISNNNYLQSLMPSDLSNFLLKNIPKDTALKPLLQESWTFSSIQENLIQIFRRVLSMNSQEIQMDLDLVSMGLESISALEIRESVQKKFSLLLPVSTLFERQTLSTLTQKIFSELSRGSEQIDCNQEAVHADIKALEALLFSEE